MLEIGEAVKSLAIGHVSDFSGPVDQLVEVARTFKIPMGIESIERSATPRPDQTLSSKKRSVRELIEKIASVSPEHFVEVDDGLVVHIYSPTEAVHPFNFLDIRLKSYVVKEFAHLAKTLPAYTAIR